MAFSTNNVVHALTVGYSLDPVVRLCSIQDYSGWGSSSIYGCTILDIQNKECEIK